MAWLITYWQPIAAALATALIAFALHSGVMWLSDIKHQNDLISQKAKLNAQCDAVQQQTKDLANAYQQKSNDLAVRLAAALRVPAQCILPADIGPASGGNAATANQGLPKGNGISTRYLIDFAGRCETVGEQLDSCQQSVTVIKKQCSQ